MSKRANLKKLSSISQEELIKESIMDFDTWPVLPSGLLEKPSSIGFDTKKVTKESLESFERFINYFNSFIQTKSTIMLFFFSALIGITGNLFITVFLSEGLSIYNLKFSLALFFFIIILVRVAIMYSPQHSMDYIIQGEYEEFPKGYESFIDLEKIGPIMKFYIDADYFPNLITKYSIFVRSFRLKDTLVNTLKKTKFIKIKQISKLSDYYPSFSISFTTNFYAMLRPGNEDEIRSEFMSLNGAITTGIIGSGVMAFELDEGEWKKYGAQFLNEISHIDLDEALNQLTDEIKSACKGPRKKSEKISRRSSRKGDIKIIEGVIFALYGNWLINYLDKINFYPGVNLNYMAITFLTLVSILSVILTVQYSIQGDRTKHFISWSIHYISILLIPYIEYLQSTYSPSQFFSEFVKMYVIGYGLWGLLPIYRRLGALEDATE